MIICLSFLYFVYTKILVFGLLICSIDKDTRTNTLDMQLYCGGIQGDSWVKDITVADELLGLCDQIISYLSSFEWLWVMAAWSLE